MKNGQKPKPLKARTAILKDSQGEEEKYLVKEYPTPHYVFKAPLSVL